MRKLCDRPGCGVEHRVRPWQLRRGWGRYCSQTCQHAAQVVRKRTFVCARPGCGRVKAVIPSRDDQYCSRLCFLMMTGVKMGKKGALAGVPPTV